ncbi:DUF4184 family protein [Pasteurella skyensis]|uniref:DUF4184 family protein n=1 Tax=Phocoenobacter skyensis TaxID=97481 RepID=A0AAJ6NE31_9PAST|nr:DUF4184 family protein [Pasteurella skyensis]MDP8161969.1 DUF4184 family protein [Pasteurella skyensis]MDP8170403.1 DUF4184 family protein [Pasteurella skyensis]MDP8172125.1 DUF4184 family protein [Pasteurella skyensis]MDP8175062.1 DUF4184 family protein [Pasteurella skyensis]MDP8176527.1 DUF4184 family protein [Pasteurella skyensis]
MPFTFSHPAIVLPLKPIFGKWVSLTALIIGSLTPDFEYFLRMRMYSEYSHTLLGALWFNLPLGIILFIIFHRIIKKTLLENSPRFIQYRLSQFKNEDGLLYLKNHWIIVSISIVIGAYSHILWDSFTHQYAFFVHYFALGQMLGHSNIPIFKFLQHLSTISGALFMLCYLLMMKVTKSSYTQPSLEFWFAFIILTIGILGIRLMFMQNLMQYGHIIVNVISAGIIALTLVCLKSLKKKDAQ